MKAKIFLFCCLMFLFLYPVCNYAISEYREMNTSVGKVIVGLDKESALEKFGVPAQAAEDLWYYSAALEKFFVLFSSQSLLNIYLYPQHFNTSLGTPLEFKAFGYFSNLKIKDITSEAQLLISEPEDFILEKPGIIIPKKAGEYQVLAKYKGIFSNPAYFLIKESQQKEIEKDTEKLISINILPYKPIVPYKSQLGFVALGTFLDFSGTYSIRDISNQADWYIKQDKEITENKGNTIFFSSLGRLTVFCIYQNLQSFPQEIYVQDKPFISNETLKHITLLPEFMSVSSEKNINLRAFGTYHSNRVEDITQKVKWEIGDKDMLTSQGNGGFLTKSVGVTEVTAVLDDFKSLATKIIVTDRTKRAFLAPIQEKKIHPENLVRDIKNEVEKLKEGFTKEEKKLILIKIIPDTLEIPLGETRQVTAQGIYSDNSQEDLTHLGDWSSSDDKIVMVSSGKIDTFSSGEAKIYVKFKGINSLPALVKVVGPKLVSIILSPQNLQMSMRDKLTLKAEGYFSDSSRKDITPKVNWKLTNLRIIKIEKGKIFPLKFGETKVYAEYLGIKSLPADIRIIFTVDWLIYMIIKGVSFLFLGIVAAFVVLYVLTEKRKNNLKNSLNKHPAEFIVNLYENAKKILAIFNLSYKECIPPLSYAELVQKNYSIENNLFLRFTAKFEEARYSHHTLSSRDASLALNDYNGFLKILLSRCSKFSLFLKYCLTLLRRMPLFIQIPP